MLIKFCLAIAIAFVCVQAYATTELLDMLKDKAAVEDTVANTNSDVSDAKQRDKRALYYQNNLLADVQREEHKLDPLGFLGLGDYGYGGFGGGLYGGFGGGLYGGFGGGLYGGFDYGLGGLYDYGYPLYDLPLYGGLPLYDGIGGLPFYDGIGGLPFYDGIGGIGGPLVDPLLDYYYDPLLGYDYYGGGFGVGGFPILLNAKKTAPGIPTAVPKVPVNAGAGGGRIKTLRHQQQQARPLSAPAIQGVQRGFQGMPPPPPPPQQYQGFPQGYQQPQQIVPNVPVNFQMPPPPAQAQPLSQRFSAVNAAAQKGKTQNIKA